MPKVVGTMEKGAVFDSVVNAEDVGAFTDMDDKASPTEDDLLVVSDTADGNARKKVSIGNLPQVIGDGTRKITVGDDAPDSPATGDLWVDTSA